MAVRLKPINQQVLVITGATSGNGLATAQEAVKRGAAVVLAARNQADLDQVAAKLRENGGRVAVCVANVAIDEDVERIAEIAISEFGGFDTWVNNAAAAMYGTVEQVSMEDHRQTFNVNYFGVLKGSLVAVRHLRTRGGAIINLGSVLADRAMIFQGPYSASKHAVMGMTDALRMELERDKAPISVTLIKPGAVHTPYPEHARNYLDEPPRLPPILYDPRLVADAVLFAAEHPRRQLYVGGQGYLISLGGRFAPRLTDLIMEVLGKTLQVSPQKAGNPELRDNLYKPKEDGELEGHQDFYVRRQSTLLQAQKHPVLAGAVLGALALLTVGVIRSRRDRRIGPQEGETIVAASMRRPATMGHRIVRVLVEDPQHA